MGHHTGSAALTPCPRPQCDTFQLCTEEELQLVQPEPPLTQAPLDQCHKRGFQAVSASQHPWHELPGLSPAGGPSTNPLHAAFPPQEACFSQIRAGLHAYQGSLGAVLQLLPEHTALLETLQLDAANLSTNIQQQVSRGGTRGRGEVGAARTPR